VGGEPPVVQDRIDYHDRDGEKAGKSFNIKASLLDLSK
jgi:hypothetical protein